MHAWKLKSTCVHSQKLQIHPGEITPPSRPSPAGRPCALSTLSPPPPRPLLRAHAAATRARRQCARSPLGAPECVRPRLPCACRQGGGVAAPRARPAGGRADQETGRGAEGGGVLAGGGGGGGEEVAVCGGGEGSGSGGGCGGGGPSGRGELEEGAQSSAGQHKRSSGRPCSFTSLG